MIGGTYADKATMAELTASMLLEVEAVLFRADEPFTFTSGLKSPVYIDCRKLISFPRIRATLMDFATTTILREVGYERCAAVAGGETAGIPFAAWLADRLALPMQYVRKKPKGFGRNARIEGVVEAGKNALLVEDLTTDGGSKVGFAEALREAGAEVTDTFVIFYYDIFPQTHERLAATGLKLHHLATWWDVLRIARGSGTFDEPTLGQVEAFLHAPLDWSRRHGGIEALPV